MRAAVGYPVRSGDVLRALINERGGGGGGGGGGGDNDDGVDDDDDDDDWDSGALDSDKTPTRLSIILFIFHFTAVFAQMLPLLDGR